MLLEKYLIMHCAPTLASLKTASLFCIEGLPQEELARQVEALDCRLERKGIRLLVLKHRGARAWLYVCRKSQLQADLRKPGVARFLARYGYESAEAAGALQRLQQRMERGEQFPHEIGVFLGYPLGDVIGFIRNGGRNCKCTGCWKVYCNAGEAQKQFARFRKCRDIYARLWSEGRSLWQLTVAA